MPPAEIESAPLPPEGNALSAELWGRMQIILSAVAFRRNPPIDRLELMFYTDVGALSPNIVYSGTQKCLG